MQRQQILQVEVPDGLRAIGSDCNSLGRILTKLLTNACKYTPTGGKICLAIEQPGRDPAITQFIVMNQAEIPKAELLRIFKKFYLVPHADPWKQSGTGLQSGNGETTFTVLLPNRVV